MRTMLRILTLLAVAFFAGCTHETQKSFEISGTVKNATEKMIYLQETQMGTGIRIMVDSSLINPAGSFHLKTKAAEESLFGLVFKTEAYPVAFVVNDASKITVQVDMSNPNGYEVTGSPASKSLNDFSQNANNRWMNLYLLGHEMDSLKSEGAPDSVIATTNTRGMALLEDFRKYARNYIENSSSPITAIWALGTYSQVFSNDDYEAMLEGIVKKNPKHKGVAAIKELSDRQAALAKQKFQEPQETNWIGKQAPELSLPDLNGNEIKLSSFRGKYVLVDFWASWCLPCRQENPNIVQAFNKYRSKNFTILGVSLDREKDDWVRAVEKDKLAWTHVSDLKEWSSLAVSTFSFTGIPFNVLLDPQGKIIAQSLRGGELDQKLSEILK